MLLYMFLMAQFAVFTLGVMADPHLPHPPLQILVLVLAGALALTPAIPWLIRSLVRARALTPHGPPSRTRFVDALLHRLPGAPGTRGAALARAPSLAVHALA